MALTHDFDHALKKELTGLQTISNFSTMLLHCLPAAPANPQTIKWIVSSADFLSFHLEFFIQF